jgi:hypothetical protein
MTYLINIQRGFATKVTILSHEQALASQRFAPVAFSTESVRLQ